MDQIIVQGGRPLAGEVAVSGAKNAALPIMASVLLGDGDYELSNIPRVVDIHTMAELLRRLGVEARWSGERDHRLWATVRGVQSCEAPYELVKTMRASILVLGPLLARWGRAQVSLPGGCAIGARPVNLHLMGLQKMGAEIGIAHGYIEAKAPRLKGATILFDQPTVTGTENLMMAATLAQGTTVLDNAASEPEVADLAAFLVRRGARISGAGTRRITIEGVDRLADGTHQYGVIPDRIEAGTYLVAGAITRARMTIDGCRPSHLQAVIQKLQAAGAHLREESNRVLINGPSRPTAVDAATAPYPGFPTDMQAQFMALMAVAKGQSLISELVFEQRLTHVAELQRMGAKIQVQGVHAKIQGVDRLSGAPVMASDLRASAGLVLAALVAEGESRIQRIYHLDRGYERMVEKLRGLGAAIERVSGDPARSRQTGPGGEEQ
ncbi:MAG TPA: UDP-N-acetylglucosamine 1-carboxyvinyltransferase [Nitrospiria bacterium]|nr:UDP-N-acetylglucosamine 1-carboxyvinyltransferase [Nitrospiria bacterium]